MADQNHAAPATTDPKSRCAPKPRAGAARVSLPVLSGAGAGAAERSPRQTLNFGRSRNGRRRAIVLILIHLAIAAHLLHWALRGETISPVEPSESMYTLETGVINAGAIFFAAALLATLIFGRFFCGWACHVVALQDLCAYALSRVNIRPKPFRSRLLVFVPLFFGLYMFVWPTFKREALHPALAAWWPQALAYLKPVAPFPGWRVELMVPDFWATFAGPVIAVPFLIICGFATVYFLGAKGFCTYGCPYGGFFAPLDTISPGRIVVDHDKCEGCGHCTATCSSNVRVHEEIRDFGMVVDKGCMKCMDCISVCPNDALSFRFDRPPILKTTKRGRATSKPGVAKPPKRAKPHDLSWPGELAVAALFAACFLALRGLYGGVPLLMAIGAAGVATFILWKGARLLTTPNIAMHGRHLRLRGAWSNRGRAFAALALLTGLFIAHSAAVRLIARSARALDDRVVVSSASVFAPVDQREAIAPEQAAAAREAIRRYTRASTWRIGGIGLASTPEIDVRLAWLHSVVGDWPKAEAALRRIMARGQLKENLASNMATIITLSGRPRAAEEFLRDALATHARFDGLRADFANRLMQSGRANEAEALYRDAISRDAHSRDARSRFQLGLILSAKGDPSGAAEQFRQAAAITPSFAPAHQRLGAALMALGRHDEGIAALKRAHELMPEDPLPAMDLARALMALKRNDEARAYIDLAEKLQKARLGAPQK